MFVSSTSNKNTLINIPEYKSAAGRRSFMNRTVTTWLGKLSQNIDHFKMHFKIYLFKQF